MDDAARMISAFEHSKANTCTSLAILVLTSGASILLFHEENMMEEMLSGGFCLKCGRSSYTLEWHTDSIFITTYGEVQSGRCCNESHRIQFEGEHMHVTCNVCHYEWKMDPLNS